MESSSGEVRLHAKRSWHSRDCEGLICAVCVRSLKACASLGGFKCICSTARSNAMLKELSDALATAEKNHVLLPRQVLSNRGILADKLQSQVPRCL